MGVVCVQSECDLVRAPALNALARPMLYSLLQWTM